MSRYSVGEKVAVIHVDYTMTQPRWGVKYFPWCDTLHGIHVEVLTIVGHHRVPGNWDDENQYDGYTVLDKNNNVWHNQYPRASYGQLDDSSNWLFNAATEEAARLINEEKAYQLEDAEKYLERLLRGVRTIREEGRTRDGNQAQANSYADQLQTHYDECVKKLTEVLGVVVENKPYVSRAVSTDDHPDIVCEHIRKVKIIFPEATASV